MTQTGLLFCSQRRATQPPTTFSNKKKKLKENWLPWVLALHSVAIRHSVSGYHQLVSVSVSVFHVHQCWL